MSLFRKKSFDNDIAFGMEQSLIDSAHEEESERVRAEREAAIIQSLDAIAALAEKYETVGRVREAELLTELLEAYADGDSEKLKQNLLETGTLFSKQDFGAADDDLSITEEDEKEVENLLSSFDDEE